MSERLFALLHHNKMVSNPIADSHFAHLLNHGISWPRCHNAPDAIMPPDMKLSLSLSEILSESTYIKVLIWLLKRVLFNEIIFTTQSSYRAKESGETRQTSHNHITGAHFLFNKLGIYQDYPKINPQPI